MFKNFFNKKNSFAVNIFPGDQEISISRGETLLAGALRSGLAWPHKCHRLIATHLLRRQRKLITFRKRDRAFFEPA